MAGHPKRDPTDPGKNLTNLRRNESQVKEAADWEDSWGETWEEPHKTPTPKPRTWGKKEKTPCVSEGEIQNAEGKLSWKIYQEKRGYFITINFENREGKTWGNGIITTEGVMLIWNRISREHDRANALRATGQDSRDTYRHQFGQSSAELLSSRFPHPPRDEEHHLKLIKQAMQDCLEKLTPDNTQSAEWLR